MIQQLLFLLFLFSAIGCAPTTTSDYEQLNALPLQQSIYQHYDLQKNSFYLDTVQTAVQNGQFLQVFTSNFQEGESIKSFIFFEPYVLKGEQDTIFRTTYLTYDLLGDSLRYLERRENELGKTPSFLVEGVAHKILRQPRCIFCKASFNALYFFHEDYGLLLTLSKYDKTVLQSLSNTTTSPKLLKQLIDVIEKDTSFVSMDCLKVNK